MSSQDISNPGSEQSNDVSKIKIKETEKKCSESNRIPDGGWAWMVVFGSFMCNVVLGNILFYLGMYDVFHGKYRGWNGSTVEISCWADLARPSAGIKNSLKNLCSHVIFIVFFKF